MDISNVKEISRETIYTGKWRTIEELVVQQKKFNRDEYTKPMTIEIATANSVVICLPYIVETDEIVLNRQFRSAVFFQDKSLNPYIYEVCAGMIDKGETPEDAVKREIKEEIGCTVLNMKKITHCYASPGYYTETFDIYCVRVYKDEVKSFGGEEIEGEDIQTHILPAKKVIEMVDNNEIIAAPTILAVNWFARNHERLKKDFK